MFTNPIYCIGICSIFWVRRLRVGPSPAEDRGEMGRKDEGRKDKKGKKIIKLVKTYCHAVLGPGGHTTTSRERRVVI